LFAFERVEKRLFTPMAFTVGYSLLGALLFALCAVPALAYVTYRKPGKTWKNPIFEWLSGKYDSFLARIIARPRMALYAGSVAGGLVVLLALTVGREFLPYLDEGSLWLQIEMPPGISIQKASELARAYRKVMRSFPEVAHVITQTGRDDAGVDPWTFSHIESCVTLKPYDEWGGDKQALIARMNQKLNAELPGMTFGFSQPILDMVNDMIAGAHSDLVVKIYGDDFGETRRVAKAIVNLLQGIPGAKDVAIDQEPQLLQLQITVNRQAAARYGINVSDVDDLIETAIGGKVASTVFVGDRSYNVNVRFIESARGNPEAISNLAISSPGGARIPLSDVASIRIGPGESMISREMGRRHISVKLDLRGRDLASFLAEARRGIETNIKYDPAKCGITWGGQFENQQRAQARLALILPAVLGLIFLILFAAFGHARYAAIIMLTVPLALVGGLAALQLRGMTLNVSSAVGFIALFGVAVQNGVIMVANLNRWRAVESDLKEAVRRGASERLRPVLMTASVATLGLLPAALSRAIGSDVQRPLATVIVGGLITATALTLLVLPAVYYVVERRVGAKAAGAKERTQVQGL
jgi:cobalt-zinc-cadmium resistance protein CzcA